MDAAPTVKVYWLGRLPYRAAWRIQRSLVAAIRAGAWPDTLLLLEHPPVFTIGRRGDGTALLWSETECARRGVEVVWTDRGGDATYHGPGQLVGYPILDLRRLHTDVLRYVRGLEDSLIAYLAGVGTASEAGGKGLTGVWSSGAKVAAIGVRLSGRVTSHGFALNLDSDLETFNAGIVPCGLAGRRATSVRALGGPRIEVAAAAAGYPPHFARCFQVSPEWGSPQELGGLPEAEPEPVLGRRPSSPP